MIKSLTKLLKTSHVLSYKHILGFDSRGLICGWLLLIFSFSLKRNKRHVKGLSWHHQLPTTALQSESKQAPKRSSSTDTPQTPQLVRGNSPSNVGKIQVSFPRREKYIALKYIYSTTSTECDTFDGKMYVLFTFICTEKFRRMTIQRVTTVDRTLG